MKAGKIYQVKTNICRRQVFTATYLRENNEAYFFATPYGDITINKNKALRLSATEVKQSKETQQ